MKLITYTDGGSRGNPGPSASGIFITNDQGEEFAKFGTFLGIQTNNFAEYTAIIEALTWIIEHREKLLGISSIECRMDSLLACRQLQGVYKVKNSGIQKLFSQVKVLQQKINKPFAFVHIYREKNTIADGQVNAALDKMTPSSIE